MFVSSGVYAIHQTQSAETEHTLPGPNAELLYKFITSEDNHKNCSLRPGKGRKIKAKAPPGIVTTYVNEKALYSIKASKKMIDGSIIVAENYNERGRLLALFVMCKISEYNP